MSRPGIVRARLNSTWYPDVKQRAVQRIVSALLLFVMAMQLVGFFHVPAATGDTTRFFEVCTANGMMSMADVPEAETDTKTSPDSTHTPQAFQCAFCAMAHSLAAPLLATIAIILGVLQTQVFYPQPYAFTLPVAPEWLQLPVRAPPLSVQ